MEDWKKRQEEFKKKYAEWSNSLNQLVGESRKWEERFDKSEKDDGKRKQIIKDCKERMKKMKERWIKLLEESKEVQKLSDRVLYVAGKKSNMTEERIRRLNCINFVWEMRS